MKIGHKLTITMVRCVLAALALNAWSAVRTEISRFEDELGANQAVIGRALRPAVREVWRTDGSARALEIVRKPTKP